MLAFLLLEFIFQTYESSHCGDELATENKWKNIREKREKRMKNLEKVIEDMNGKCYQSEIVETDATKDEQKMKIILFVDMNLQTAPVQTLLKRRYSGSASPLGTALYWSAAVGRIPVCSATLCCTYRDKGRCNI